ncbi:MAG: hypothetical protein KC464_23395, partial [Myxococcales bacterium]|nr:hypothetical protein [Myxococcales bacterium]
FGRASGAVALGGTRTLLTTDSGESWLWDSRLGVDAGVLPDHRAEIVGIAEDDGRVVTASLDGGVTVTTRAGEIVGHQNAGAEILAWAPRARLAGLRDGRVLVLAADGAPVRELAHGGAAVTAVAVTADGSLAATGSLDGSIAVWSLPDGVERARVASDRDAVAALVFVGGRLVEGRRSGVVRVRRTDGSPEGALQLEASIARLIDDGAGQIAIATVAGAGQRMGLDGVSVEALPGAPLAAAPGVIAMGGPGGEVYVERGGGATVLVGRHDLPVSHAVFAPDGAMLWTADDGGALRGWDLTTRRPWVALTPGDHAITALTITGDGAWLIIGLADGSVRVVPATLSATRARACSTLRDHGRSPPSGLCP